MQREKTAYRSAVAVVLVTGLILLIPLVAMQFTDQVVWSNADFVAAGALLLGTGFMYMLVARKADSKTHKAAVGLAVGTALLLVWVNLAVGIIGNENNPANVMYIGVLAVELLGALIAHFQPRGMTRVLFATALAQALVAVIALLLWKPQVPLDVVNTLGVNAFFVMLFVGSALLFRHVASQQTPAGARPGG